MKAILRLETAPRPRGFRKLEEPEHGFRIRVGDWRILYDILDREAAVIVYRIGPRKDVYKQK